MSSTTLRIAFFSSHMAPAFVSLAPTRPNKMARPSALSAHSMILFVLSLYTHRCHPSFGPRPSAQLPIFLTFDPLLSIQKQLLFTLFFSVIQTTPSSVCLVVYVFQTSTPLLPTNWPLDLFPAFFLGYSDEHKGYRCLDLITGRVHISRHVTFDKTVFPFSSRSSTHTAPPATPPSPSRTLNPLLYNPIVATPNSANVAPTPNPSPAAAHEKYWKTLPRQTFLKTLPR